MGTLENKIPEQQPEQPEEQPEQTEQQERTKQPFELEKSVQKRFHCSKPEAYGFLSDLEKEGIDICDKNAVEEYFNKLDIQEIFDEFKRKWTLFHETP